MGVALFNSILDTDWILNKKGSYWIIAEPKSDLNKEVHIGGCTSLAFTLDREKVNPLPFLSTTSPKKGIRSVCDAMVVATLDGHTYFLAMDLKSTRENGATRQIEMGRRLFEWLTGVAQFNGHWKNGEPQMRFFGVVNLAQRKQERKGLSRRSAELPAPEKSPFGDYYVFKLRNHPKVNIADMIRVLYP